MSEEKDIKEQGLKSNRVLTNYFIVVVVLGFIVAGIIFCAFNTAFVEKEKWEKVAESQKRPNRLILPGRGNIYSVDSKLMATSVPRYYTYMDFRRMDLP